MRKNKKKRTSDFGVFLVLLTVIALCIALMICFKVFEKVEVRVEEYQYPLTYSDIAEKYAQEYDVPLSVVLAMIKVESNFLPEALSHAGACGLMQLMPDTFKWLVEKTGEKVTDEDIYDPEINIKYGTYYVSILYDKLNNWDHVYAAYNAGLTNVNKWLSDDRYSKDGILTEIPFEETANHVIKIQEAREKYIELYDLGE